MQIDERRGTTCSVALSGELDLESAPAMLGELNRLLALDYEIVVVDLRSLEFIDSTGLRCLLQAARRSRATRDQLRIVEPRGAVERVLQLTQVDRALPLIAAA